VDDEDKIKLAPMILGEPDGPLEVVPHDYFANYQINEDMALEFAKTAVGLPTDEDMAEELEELGEKNPVAWKHREKQYDKMKAAAELNADIWHYDRIIGLAWVPARRPIQ
jgi:hypothetical protein